MDKDKILMMFRLMEYDYLTENQLKMIESFEAQFLRTGRLSARQIEILEDVFKQAAEKEDGTAPHRKRKGAR